MSRCEHVGTRMRLEPDGKWRCECGARVRYVAGVARESEAMRAGAPAPREESDGAR